MSMPTTLPPRHAVDPALTWDLQSVFASDAAWEKACEEMSAHIESLAAFPGTLGESPQRLATWLESYAAVAQRMGPIWVYAGLQHATDAADQTAGARAGRAQALGARLAAAAAFAEPEIMALGAETLHAWLAAEPRLAIYAHAFERLLDRAAHVRSAEVEKLLAQAGDAFATASRTHGVLMDADLRFEPARSQEGDTTYEVAQGTLRNLMQHPDRRVRQTAWEHYADGYLAFENTLANCYHAHLKRNVFYARARGYTSALEASLAPHRIPQAVYENVINTFRAQLPVWQRYFALRRQVLGLETLAPYDMWAPLTGDAPTMTFEQSVDWIAEGLAPLGEAYVAQVRRGCLEQRWVDIYPNQGKRQGAFSAGAPGTHPFILMNFNDDINGLSTLAHELGHSLHSYLTWQHQPLVYARYSTFAAEVASNFNQALVRDYLLHTQTGRGFQIALLEEAMSNFYRYFFIMPSLARFEWEAHQRVERGQPLTAQGLNDLMADLLAEGYGEVVTADRTRSGVTWATFPHLYNSFYVFQYATGIAGAHALAERVIVGDAAATERYLAFLRAGGSRYPVALLQETGVDLTTPESIEAAFAVMAHYIERLEALLAE